MSDIPNRLLAIVSQAKRKCGNCKHFDLAAGQAALKEWPAFMGAAAVLAPDRMGRPRVPTVEQLIEEGNTPEEAKLKHAEAKDAQLPETNVGWDEIGSCAKHSQGRAMTDSCKDWT